jgi:hypothetical protein
LIRYFSIRIDFDAEGGSHEVITQSESKQEQQLINDTNVEEMNDTIRGVDDRPKAGFEGRRVNKRRKRDDMNEVELQEMVI